MTNLKRLSIALLAAAFLFAAGCAKKKEGDTCDQDSDCEEGLVCMVMFQEKTCRAKSMKNAMDGVEEVLDKLE